MAVKEKIIALTQDGMENFVHDYDDAHIYHNAMMAHDYYKDNKCFSYNFGDNFECWVSGNGEITINSGLGMLYGYQLEIEDPVVVQVDAGSTNGHKGYVVVEIERGIQTEQAQAFAYNSQISGEWPVLQKDDILTTDGNFQMAIAEYTVDTDKDITSLNNIDNTLIIGTGGTGGGASTTDQITTLGALTITDGTELNTVLDDHNDRLDAIEADTSIPAHAHAIADVTGLQTELDTIDTRLDAVEAGGGTGGGASTTDQITTNGMTEIADGTPLNTILNDHENKLDRIAYETATPVTLLPEYSATNKYILLERVGDMCLFRTNQFISFDVTPVLGTKVADIISTHRPSDQIDVFAVSADGRERVYLHFDESSDIIFDGHYVDGVAIPPGSTTGMLYFNCTFLAAQSQLLTKPGPKEVTE